MEFTAYHDAALCAEYLTQVEGTSSELAICQGMKLVRKTLDRRELQRWRKRVRAMKPKLKRQNENHWKRMQEEYKAMLRAQYNAIVGNYRSTTKTN